MLSERITRIFQVLQCSNTDIARFAGCTPSNISRLKSGLREPGPDSRSVRRLAEGIYRYADYENMLTVLCELCETEDQRAENMIPAILSWLYAETEFSPVHTVIPKSRQEKVERRRIFGGRLNAIMSLLEIANIQLASALNVDVSLISRYRSGALRPDRNERIRKSLPERILVYAKRKECTSELAGFIGVSTEELSTETLYDWLYEAKDHTAEMAETVFKSIDMFIPGEGMYSGPPELPPIEVSERYWGTRGLRNAVVRFLADSAREGGELWLYSDEPMDWMTDDPDFFALWASLMVSCVRNKVHIKIIHNMDRVDTEMVSAINGWLPLYLSGMIEPYIFRRERNTRFYHTVFLRPGKAGIFGAFPTEMSEKQWYDYILDSEQLNALESGYGAMLTNAEPFLQTYSAEKDNEFWQFCGAHRDGQWVFVHDGLSIGTMPEDLLLRILDRSGIEGTYRKVILQMYERRRQMLYSILDDGSVDEILCLPNWEEVLEGRIKVISDRENRMDLTYLPDEYAEHISAVREMVMQEKRYHMTLLPRAPFRDLQIFTMKDKVVVLRCSEPYVAFAFSNATLTQAVSEYFKHLKRQFAADRSTVAHLLDSTAGEVNRRENR